MKNSLKSIQQKLAIDAIINPKTQNKLKGGTGGAQAEPPPWGNFTLQP